MGKKTGGGTGGGAASTTTANSAVLVDPSSSSSQQPQPRRTARQQIASTHAVAAIKAQRARMAEAAQTRDAEAERAQTRTLGAGGGRVSKAASAGGAGGAGGGLGGGAGGGDHHRSAVKGPAAKAAVVAAAAAASTTATTTTTTTSATASSSSSTSSAAAASAGDWAAASAARADFAGAAAAVAAAGIAAFTASVNEFLEYATTTIATNMQQSSSLPSMPAMIPGKTKTTKTKNTPSGPYRPFSDAYGKDDEIHPSPTETAGYLDNVGNVVGSVDKLLVTADNPNVKDFLHPRMKDFTRDLASTTSTMQELLEAAAVLSTGLSTGVFCGSQDVIKAAAEFKALAHDADALAAQFSQLQKPGSFSTTTTGGGIPTAPTASSSSVSSNGSSAGSTTDSGAIPKDVRPAVAARKNSRTGTTSVSPTRLAGPSGQSQTSVKPTHQQKVPAKSLLSANLAASMPPPALGQMPVSSTPQRVARFRTTATADSPSASDYVLAPESPTPPKLLATSPQRDLPPGTILNHNNKPIRLPKKKPRVVNIPLPLPPPSTLHLIRRDVDDVMPLQRANSGGRLPYAQDLEIIRYEEDDNGGLTGSDDDEDLADGASVSPHGSGRGSGGTGVNGVSITPRPVASSIAGNASSSSSSPSRLAPAKKKMGVAVASKKKRVGGISTSAPSSGGGGLNTERPLWTETPSSAVMNLLRTEGFENLIGGLDAPNSAAPAASATAASSLNSLSILASRCSSVPTPGPLTNMGFSAVNASPVTPFPDSLTTAAAPGSRMFEFGKTAQSVSVSVVNELAMATTPVAGKRKATHTSPATNPAFLTGGASPVSLSQQARQQQPPQSLEQRSGAPPARPAPRPVPVGNPASGIMVHPSNLNPAVGPMPRNADGLIDWAVLDAPVPYGTLPIDISNLPDLLDDRELEELERIERNPPESNSTPQPQQQQQQQQQPPPTPQPSRLTPAERRLLSAVDTISAPPVTSRSRRRSRLSTLLQRSGSRGGVGLAGSFPGGGTEWCFFCEFEMLFGGGAVWRRAAAVAAIAAVANANATTPTHHISSPPPSASVPLDPPPPPPPPPASVAYGGTNMIAHGPPPIHRQKEGVKT